MSLAPPSLYGLADADALGGVDKVPEAAVAMVNAGVEWIQLRIKRGDDPFRYRAIRSVLHHLKGRSVTVWIDDRADLAVLAAADAAGPRIGLHLGQHDLPPAAARRVVDSRMPIGRSCHTLDQVRAAHVDQAVDVVAIGPVFTTRSKASPDPTVGLDGVRVARTATTKPLVAIGGITPHNARAVRDAGADTVAILGALCRAECIDTAAQRFFAQLSAADTVPSSPLKET